MKLVGMGYLSSCKSSYQREWIYQVLICFVLFCFVLFCFVFVFVLFCFVYGDVRGWPLL